MSKIIYTHKYVTPVKATEFKLENILSYEHHQCCCESVYVDMEHLDTFRKQIDEMKEIEGMEIKTVEGEGIVVFLYHSWRPRFGIFLACRNEQNGYYSDDLTLIVKQEGMEAVKIDLQEAGVVSDYID